MPSYLVPGASTCTTEPTGSRSGSAAAMPDRTFTPDAVVLPLQYAVAEKRSRDPGIGGEGSTAGRSRAAKRESRIVTSYNHTNPTTTTTVASTFRHSELARIITRNVRIRR